MSYKQYIKHKVAEPEYQLLINLNTFFFDKKWIWKKRCLDTDNYLYSMKIDMLRLPLKNNAFLIKFNNVFSDVCIIMSELLLDKLPDR